MVDLADRDLVSYLDEVRAKIAQSVQFDQSKYRLEYGGQFENQQRTAARLEQLHLVLRAERAERAQLVLEHFTA